MTVLLQNVILIKTQKSSAVFKDLNIYQPKVDTPSIPVATLFLFITNKYSHD